MNAVRVIDLFREWDTDGNGMIDRDEFRKAMPELGFHAPKKDSEYFRALDRVPFPSRGACAQSQRLTLDDARAKLSRAAVCLYLFIRSWPLIRILVVFSSMIWVVRLILGK